MYPTNSISHIFCRYDSGDLEILQRGKDGLVQRDFTIESQIMWMQRCKLVQEEWRSLRTNQAQLSIAVLIHWCILLNVQLGADSNILVIDSASGINSFVDHGFSDTPHMVGGFWKKRYRASIETLLVPTHIPASAYSQNGRRALKLGGHYVLVIVNLKSGIVESWDSLSPRWDRQIDVGRIKGFLEGFLPDGMVPKLTAAPQSVPCQSGANCGIFCIEFIRAYVAGARPGQGLSEMVSEKGMASCRARIEAELVAEKLSSDVPLA